MLEAPEAKVLAKQINETLSGKLITIVAAGYTPHKFTLFNGDPAEYETILEGGRIIQARNYGGMVGIETQDSVLILSDGVNLRYLSPGESLPSRHQLLVGFSDESCMVASVRMYGAIWAYRNGGSESDMNEYLMVARTKPQVLSGDFTEEYFMGLISAGNAQGKTAKAFLATKQTIPGLGNGVLQDILYNACIHPRSKVSSIDHAGRRRLYAILRSTLREMTDKGGRNSETDLFGRNGGYRPWLSKDTEGKTCHRCGGIIVKENYLGGSIYYCTGCQVIK